MALAVGIGCCTGTSCDAITPPAHGILSTSIALTGTVVLVKCILGYRFLDATTELPLFCQETKTWNDTFGTCERKSEMTVCICT